MLILLWVASLIVAASSYSSANLQSAKDLNFGQELNGIKLHPNTGLNMTQMVTKYDYPIETHKVQTEDGYILTVFRIPHGRNEDHFTTAKKNSTTPKPPILLMHGLLSSSADMVNVGPEKGLGFLLADAGYDVWMGNQRGNLHSREHISLDINKDKEKFFNFTFHEIGYYDLPATIDYILNTTQQENILYIGHSQGTTVFFVMAADRPEYNQKIRLMAALAPATYLSNAKSPVAKFLAEFYSELSVLFDIFRIYEILPYHRFYLYTALIFCNGQNPSPDICLSIISLMCGFDFEQWDASLATALVSNSPAGSSVGQGKHFLQIFKSGRFQHYDYGFLTNIAKYEREEPAIYDLSKVTAPIALYYAQNDWLVDVTDVERMTEELPNVVAKKLISYPKFNHLDFLVAVDVVELLHQDLLNDLEIYGTSN